MYIRRPAAPGMRDAAFFAAFALYAWAGIDPRLIYHWQGPVFTTIPGFFNEFLAYPGGPADYFQRWIAQAYTSQLWGVAATTLQVVAVVILTHRYLTALAGGRLPAPLSALPYVPAILLLYHFNLYYDRAPILLSLLAGITAGVMIVHLSHRWRSQWTLLAASLAMMAAVFYLADMAVVFFAPAAVIAHYTQRRRPQVWIVPLLLVLMLPIAAPAIARGWFLDADPRRDVGNWGLYLFYAGSAAATLWHRPFKPVRKERLCEALITASLLVCLAGVAAVSYRLNGRDRRLTALDYYTLREDWPAAIETARNLPADDFNSLTRYEVNLALHQTNRLGDEMFRFPQKGSTVLNLRADPFLPYMMRVTDLCLRLGRVNEAERFGSEAMLLRDRDPHVYRQMARINLVKGQAAAARKFLTVLTYDAESGAWARERLRELDRDPLLERSGEVQLLRRRMLRTDDMMPVWQRPDRPEADMERLLHDQLAQDPTNRMAFEFLMGDYLLARDMVAVYGLMPGMAAMTGPAYVDPAGRRRTPRHYQEAMAIYEGGTGAAVHLPGVEVEPETRRKFEDFKRTVRQYVTRDAAMGAAWNQYRDTYFFYFTFGAGDYR